jgi:hypothetical protein
VEPLDRVERVRVHDDGEQRSELVDEIDQQQLTQRFAVGALAEQQRRAERRRE